MTLVYRADITGIALKNSAIEGFTFDADQHHYDLTYEGDFALTADDFDVTVDGRSAIVVKNVEDLGNGNYRVAIAAVTPDLLTGNLYTYNFNKKRITGDVTGDGLVNVADVNALVSIILGLSEKNELADVNGDGVVNVADINALVSIILGK